MALKREEFTKGSRTWASVPDSKGNIGIFYQATQAEYDRVKNKTYTTVQPELSSGSTYVGQENGKYYVLHSAYELKDNNTYGYVPYPPGLETENGNANQFTAIRNDKALKEQLTQTSATNTSADPNQPGSEGSSQPINTPPNEKSAPKIEGSHLVYPEDLGSSDQDRIRFKALKYSTNGKGGEADIPVFLPIQSSITDQNVVGWEPDTINPIELRAVNASLKIMQSGSNIAQVASDQLTHAIQGLRQESSSVRTYLAGQAVGVNNLLSRLEGQVLNPNLELLFQGPQLRPFSFTFKLSARTQKESNVIREIINYFKRNMAPQANDGDLFVRAPNIFEIEYQFKGAKHPGINYIKDCALTNCSTDYTPLGSYMSYDNGTMVAYTMTLQFQELEPVYSRDYTNKTNIEY